MRGYYTCLKRQVENTHTDRQADRQRYKQRDRQTDRQADRQTRNGTKMLTFFAVTGDSKVISYMNCVKFKTFTLVDCGEHYVLGERKRRRGGSMDE